MKHETRFLETLSIVLLASCFLFLSSYAQDPIQLSTETEDIALTDDINVARAQVAKYPNNPEAHFNLAIALSRTSQVEEAIKELRRTKILIRKEKNKGMIDKKIIEYMKILKNDPQANNIRYRLAFGHYLKAYLLSKELEKAKKDKSGTIRFFDSNTLVSHDENPTVLENLNLSTSYFNELLTINPNDNWAKIYLGFILAEQFNEVNKARNLWLEVLKKDPNNPAPHFFLGELQIKEGNLKEGILEISQAVLLRSLGY